MQVSLFNGFADKNPKPITIREVVEIIRADQRLQVLTENHRRYRAAGDTARADAEKEHMPCYSVAVQFSGGKQQKHIVSYTGLSIVDLDHIASEDMVRVLTLVRNDPHTLLAYTTISGQGVRAIFRYALNKTKDCTDFTDSSTDGSSTQQTNNPSNLWLNNQEYRRVFEQGNEYYSNLVGIEPDEKCKNATRLSGMAHDPEVYYNPDAVPIIITPGQKRPAHRPRRVESSKMTVERCEAVVLRELEQRGVVYEAGNHNKYISDACYMMNRYGVSLDDCTAWALERFSDYQQQGNDVASIVRSCYAQTEEHGTARLPRATESRYASIRDIQDWLRGNDIRIRHNVITRKREISFNDNVDVNADAGGASVATAEALASLRSATSSPSCRPDGWSTSSSTLIWKELEDKSVNSLYCRFCLDTGRQAKISDFYIIIESDFYPEYHPMHEYLESLPAWDGTTDHIDRVASMVHVAGCAQEMHNRFFKQWLVAMVAAWLEPDKTNHEILTYIGPQGIYKSTFVRHLLPPQLSGYFSTKNFAGRMTKDDRLELTEMALISLEELDSLQPAELNQLKAITTDPTVNERAAFARYKERRTHIASFCGTGNNPRFLTDLTDNRRWLPFMVRDIDSPWTHPMPYTEMYAQAYALYRAGFRYWFDADDNAELARHNRQFEEPCMEEELIATYLRVPYGEEVGEFLTATRIIELVGASVKRPLSPKKVAFAMNRLGFEARRIRNVRGWNVIILTGNDIKEEQRLNAHRSMEDV